MIFLSILCLFGKLKLLRSLRPDFVYLIAVTDSHLLLNNMQVCKVSEVYYTV